MRLRAARKRQEGEASHRVFTLAASLIPSPKSDVSQICLDYFRLSSLLPPALLRGFAASSALADAPFSPRPFLRAGEADARQAENPGTTPRESD